MSVPRLLTLVLRGQLHFTAYGAAVGAMEKGLDVDVEAIIRQATERSRKAPLRDARPFIARRGLTAPCP
jgi:hypothetical protein